MPNVLIHGDTVRYPTMRHEIPLMVPDPFLYVEAGGQRHVVVSSLERSRLVQEDTLCHDSMTKVERKWLRSNRPPEAKHWNLLTDLDVRHLAYA